MSEIHRKVKNWNFLTIETIQTFIQGLLNTIWCHFSAEIFDQASPAAADSTDFSVLGFRAAFIPVIPLRKSVLSRFSLEISLKIYISLRWKDNLKLTRQSFYFGRFSQFVSFERSFLSIVSHFVVFFVMLWYIQQRHQMIRGVWFWHLFQLLSSPRAVTTLLLAL